MKSSVIVRRPTTYGYIEEAEFRTTENNGSKRYDLYIKERWEDGHFTLPTWHHIRFRSAAEGNKMYKQYLVDGFQKA